MFNPCSECRDELISAFSRRTTTIEDMISWRSSRDIRSDLFFVQ